MIGIISKTSEKKIVQEFFELFKTPWEFYKENCYYDVVLCTGDYVSGIQTKLLLIYGSNKTQFDIENNIGIGLNKKRTLLQYDKWKLPIYKNALTFLDSSNPVFVTKEPTDSVGISVGIKINSKNQTILRIGYDLFREIYFLLSSGQLKEYAHVPTLEIHISILRNLILSSGIPLIEIPPVPSGYTFITCLTHDIDFAGIRFHRFDRTMFGFIYRALIGSVIGVLRGRTSWKKLLKNWKAVILLPLVYLGCAEDFFNQFDRYIEIEKGLGSTFFVIPYKNRDGQNILRQRVKRRAMRYDVTDIEPELQKLIETGCEIGLHGIDAWRCSKKGRGELERITQLIGDAKIGLRMHWLYFYGQSPQILEDAGFYYDSSFGYNDAIGFRGGTTQVFRPPDAKKVFELPLHIQDTALFYSGRMGLTESQAHSQVEKVIKNTKIYGGLLTINWHQRSLGPERLWDDFYIRILEDLKACNVWFARAMDAVKWFHKRRSVFFEKAEYTENTIKLKLGGYNPNQKPGLLVRIHLPIQTEKETEDPDNYKGICQDFPLLNKTEFEISF